MLQSFFGGSTDTLNNAATEYNLLGAAYNQTWTATENIRRMLIAAGGVMKNWYVELAAAPGVGTTWTFTLMVNGVASALVVAITGAATSGTDVANAVTIAAGDVVSIRAVATGAATNTTATWAMEFAPTTATRFVMPAASFSGPTMAGAVNYHSLFGRGNQGFISTETVRKNVCPMDGTLQDFYVTVPVAPGGAAQWTFYLRKNGVDIANCTMTGAATTANMTAQGIDIAPGDMLTLKIVATVLTPADATRVEWGVCIQPDTDGESIVACQNNASASTSVVNYNLISGAEGTGWSATEGTLKRVAGVNPSTFKNFYVKSVGVSTPGAGKSYTFRLRKNTADGNLVVVINDSDTTDNDIVHSDSIVQGDDLDVSVTPSGTPTSNAYTWAFVQYMATVISVNDTITPDEALTYASQQNISITDTITPTEALTYASQQNISVSDTVTPTEFLSFFIVPPVGIGGVRDDTLKHFQYKIYDPTGDTFLENVPVVDIITEPNFNSQINGGLGQLIFRLNRPFDDFGDNLNDMNIVRIYETDRRHRTPRLIYAGFISSVDPFIEGGVQGVEVVLLGFVSFLSLSKFKVNSPLNYDVTKTTMDPGQMIKDIIDHHLTIYPNSPIHYTTASIATVGISATNVFQSKTWFEAITDAKELAGTDYFFRVEPDGLVTFKLKPSSPTYAFTVGKDVMNLPLHRTNERVINKVRLIYNNGASTIDFEDAISQATYGVRESIITEPGITNLAAATARVQKEVNDNKDAKYNVKNFDLNSLFDFESILGGETCKILNVLETSYLGSNMQIHGFSYTPDVFTLELEIITDFGTELAKFIA